MFTRREQLYSKFKKNGTGAEIGVAYGGNSVSLLKITNPIKLHLIDCWEVQVGEFEVDHNNKANHEERYQSVINLFGKNPVVQIHRMFSFAASQMFEDNYFDWIYIDANHMKDGFRQDVECWYPKVKSGGIISGHDYLMENPNIEVKEALDEWMNQMKLELEFVTQERYPSWAIRKP